MKKIISAIFLSLLCFCVRAEESGVVYDERQVYISAAAFEDALNKFVADDYKAPAAAMFLEKRDANTGKINLSDMLRVCVAANITYCLEHPDDPACKGEYSIASYKKDKCDDFVEYVLSNSRGAIDLDRAIGTEALCGEWNGLWLPMETGGHKCVGLDGYVLKYSYSCKKGKSGTCVSDFKQLKTQSPIAKQFISSYGKKQGLSLTCLNNYVKRGVQGFIQCTAGGKAYEFEFNNLNKNPDKDSIESENKMLCDFFGGTVLSARDDTDKKYNFRCDVSQDICNGDMKTLAQKIGHTINYTTGACVLGKDALKLTEVELNRIEGVDSNRFLKNQLRSEAAQRGVEEYLINQYGAKSAKCGPEIYTLADSSAANAKYVLRCKADGRAVDFVFEDLTEKIDYVAAAGASRMACESLGGRGDDRNCRGLEPAECVKLNDVLIARGRAGTHYDTTLGGCILNDAEIAHNVDLGLQIASGVVLTVATVGMSSVPVVVLVGASVATDLVFEGLDRWKRSVPYNEYKRFMDAAEECGDLNSLDALGVNRYCVISVFSDYSSVMNGFLPELAPEVQAKTISKLVQMSDLVGDEEVVRKMSVEKIASVAAEVVIFAGVLLVNPEKLATKVDNVDDIAKLATKVSKKFGKNFDEYLRSGKSIAMSADRLSGAEWAKLDKLLEENYGVKLVDEVVDDVVYKVFRRVDDVSNNTHVGRTITTSEGKVIDIPDFAETIDPNVIQDKAIRELYQRAVDVESEITDDIVEITSIVGGELHGLNHRLKTPESALGKISRTRNEEPKLKDATDFEIFETFTDIVRYTQLGTTKTLTKQIERTISELERRGYEIVSVKNTFDSGPGLYKDFKVRFRHKSGQVVELQFNTPNNVRLKDMETPYYNIRRVSSKDSPEYKEAEVETLKLFSGLEVPDGVLGLRY